MVDILAHPDASLATPGSAEPSPSSQPKRAKAQNKTPLQKEALEAAYKSMFVFDSLTCPHTRHPRSQHQAPPGGSQGARRENWLD